VGSNPGNESHSASSRLSELLRRAGLTQAQLATEIGTTAASISRITAGKQGLTVEMATKVAEVTGVRVSWLLTGELPIRADAVGQDISRAAYEAGWRAALQAVLRQVGELEADASGPPAKAPTRPSRVAAVDAAQRHRAELERKGLAKTTGPARARRGRRA
jgi:transcriptional regulator with XRE-family HTH domain